MLATKNILGDITHQQSVSSSFIVKYFSPRKTEHVEAMELENVGCVAVTTNGLANYSSAE
jgi:hypothetical protein